MLQLKLQYIEENKWFHQWYNRFCLDKLNKNRNLYTDSTTEISNEKPLFITGFFRSGTSVTAKLLNIMGMDLGPEKHLLKAKNKRAQLNPDGFFENYLFMETSLMLFTKLNSWGHLPPTESALNNFEFSATDKQTFAEFTLCGVHDDRISNKNKMAVLKNYDLFSLNTYLQKEFKFPYAIKNPHFSVMTEFLLKKWPQATLLVCFREPMAAIASAAKITSMLNQEIYLKYYEQLVKLPDNKVAFFSFDHLLKNPQKSLNALCNNFNLATQKIKIAESIIKPALHRYKNAGEITNEKVKEIYHLMINKAINK